MLDALADYGPDRAEWRTVRGQSGYRHESGEAVPSCVPRALLASVGAGSARGQPHDVRCRGDARRRSIPRSRAPFEGSVPRLGHVLSEPAYAQDPPSRGDDTIPLDRRAGMEDFRIRRVVVESGDRISPAAASGIAGCRHHHPEGGAFVPLGPHAREAAVDGRLDEAEEVGAQAEQDRLRFRVAEPAVELDHPRCSGGIDHQARVQETGIGCPGRRESFHGRADDLAHDAFVHRRIDHRRRRVCAHPTGVRPRVSLSRRLVVL